MRLGIVGLPNVGKSTLFNAITKAGAESANYPFCTIEPNVGVVDVPDKRLDVLEKMYNSKRKVHASIEFYDIAGLVKGASKGEGLGNKFLSHIRESAAIVHVVRCFEDENIVHVEGSVDPIRDIETISLELVFSDLEVLERRMEKSIKLARSGDKTAKAEMEIMEKIKSHLESGKPVRTLDLTEDEQLFVKELFLLTSKPVLYAANISEDDLLSGNAENEFVKKVRELANSEKSEIVTVCASLEEQLSTLTEEEEKEMLSEYGLEESGLDKLIASSYKLLGLMSFLTAGTDEVRAWTITNGTKAPKAAGKIHTDIERGFIRAEIVSYEDLINCGSEAAAKEKGLYRLEGKDYIMKDGDVVNFRFNV
ncbi:GTP-binding protein YchF [Clostridium pasteurianum DSM 525 = ATCC 6013]|uniref:Ribosome-binding ATPase YchF n=1 Tax=Clostridium pasteurianum DSM 525 = ATCC 6013 TaxID=1262449 RepID=A0A0H3J9R5_CLOPA|nr:redox-regulated ATPase YchF [Clostridium pasteurianum]AJA47920.1 GTP-binding protein YchF [Clostridium pasteurianum DSM 525 = ATCC 6013]AJA51908.1 GTP-binding protein YchF [Clostridium pasteurianum DSM 525 = ATCC 6013]AOZ75207.1 GTP-binding protein [Clostridium pasteurianum DSM 525 = ATCC 6013]AOZ79002.1 GTP-binding protein [Clostridium pasteurianum]ELP59823.1 GTP-binding protein YchF [Clostridium pasteurianum DSM 525 = ATCC 6013]